MRRRGTERMRVFRGLCTGRGDGGELGAAGLVKRVVGGMVMEALWREACRVLFLARA